MPRATVVVLGALLATGPATGGTGGLPGEASCPPGMQATAIITAYFGRAIAPDRRVSDAEWQGFQTPHIQQRLRDLKRRLGGDSRAGAGFTVTDARGVWHAETETVEDSKMLIVIVPAAERDPTLDALDEAIEVYRARFAQGAVGVTVVGGCARGLY
jgi:hypothetical protein